MAFGEDFTRRCTLLLGNIVSPIYAFVCSTADICNPSLSGSEMMEYASEQSGVRVFCKRSLCLFEVNGGSFFVFYL